MPYLPGLDFALKVLDGNLVVSQLLVSVGYLGNEFAVGVDELLLAEAVSDDLVFKVAHLVITVQRTTEYTLQRG